MSFEKVPGQHRAKRFLKALVKGGHIPHAMLFSGMAGVGKEAVAREFAKTLNCHNRQDFDACDSCVSCLKIEKGLHPDLMWVTSEGAYIKIDQIRELKKRARYRPFEGGKRVVIVRDSQKLKEEAANALLKLLEEPPKNNFFILLAPEPQALLPTIVSRCCHVRFQPLEEETVENHLRLTYQISEQQAKEIAKLAEGSLQRAAWLAEEDRVLKWKQILNRLEQLDRYSMIEFFKLMNEWARNSEDLEQDLECIKLWLKDHILTRLTSNYRPLFETGGASPEGARSAPVDSFFALFNRVEEAVQNLRHNANKQLTLESVCLAIRDVVYGQSSRYSFSQGRQSISLRSRWTGPEKA